MARQVKQRKRAREILRDLTVRSPLSSAERELAKLVRQPLVILIASLLFALLTGSQLVFMSRIMGWLPGGHVERRRVLEVTREERWMRRHMENVYMLQFEGTAPGVRGGSVEVSRDVWEFHRRDDFVEVVWFLPDPQPYLRKGVDPAALGLSITMLAAELFVSGYMIRSIWLTSRRRAKPRPDEGGAHE